jgi:hypothetical protein
MLLESAFLVCKVVVFGGQVCVANNANVVFNEHIYTQTLPACAVSNTQGIFITCVMHLLVILFTVTEEHMTYVGRRRIDGLQPVHALFIENALRICSSQCIQPPCCPGQNPRRPCRIPGSGSSQGSGIGSSASRRKVFQQPQYFPALRA